MMLMPPSFAQVMFRSVVIYWILSYLQHHHAFASQSSLKDPPSWGRRAYSTTTPIIDTTTQQRITEYSTVGFINLSKRPPTTTTDVGDDSLSDDDELKVTGLELFVECIQNQMNDCENNTIATVCAFFTHDGHGHEEEDDVLYCLEEKIHCSLGAMEGDDDIRTDLSGVVAESLGCVGDTVVILDDNDDVTNNIDNCRDHVIRLKAGIERQRQSIIAKHGYSETKEVRIIILVFYKMGESLSYVTNLSNEMHALQDKFKCDDESFGVVNLIIDVIPTRHESLLCDARNCDWLRLQDNDVPLLQLDHFIKGIVSNLGGIKYEDIAISSNYLSIEKKQSDDDDSKFSQTSSEQISEGNQIQGFSNVEHQHIPITSNDGSITKDSTTNNSKNTSNHDGFQCNRALQIKIMKLSDEVIITSEKSISELESKQDEILYNPENTIPILEFGADAESILQEASRRFDQEDVSELVNGKNDTAFIEGRFHFKSFPYSLLRTP